VPPGRPVSASAEEERLRPQVRRVALVQGQVLYEPGAPIAHVRVPIDALASLLALGAGEEAVEAGLIGPEGLVGLAVFLGAPTAAHRAVCHLPGDAWRLPAAALGEALTGGAAGPPGLAARLGRSTQALLAMTPPRGRCVTPGTRWRSAPPAGCCSSATGRARTSWP
jgi:hypothetical protein